MEWTEDRIELLKKLWSEGFSAAQIAKELGGGVTRNHVIGKVHRLGLAGRATPSRPGTSEAPARKIFVSHASKEDGARALSIAYALESLGRPCWLAPRDIPAGAEWNKTVLRAVESSAALLVLVSEAATRSEFLQAEVHRAFDLKIRVFQVQLDASVDPAHIDMRLLRVQRIGAVDDSDESIAERIAAALKSV